MVETAKNPGVAFTSALKRSPSKHLSVHLPIPATSYDFLFLIATLDIHTLTPTQHGPLRPLPPSPRVSLPTPIPINHRPPFQQPTNHQISTETSSTPSKHLAPSSPPTSASAPSQNLPKTPNSNKRAPNSKPPSPNSAPTSTISSKASAPSNSTPTDMAWSSRKFQDDEG